MRAFRQFIRAISRERWASILQLLALAIAVVAIFFQWGLWWALIALAAALVLVSLGIDRSDE